MLHQDAATCMDTKNIMLSEISQIVHDSPESEVSRRVKCVETEWNTGYQGLGDLLFKRYSFSLGMVKNFWKWTVVLIAQHCKYSQRHLIVH